ncbi:MAG: DUF445 domain-containing protein [Magnetospirillum sp.]|nr:DUF445 domain-containing protein [Magnetospirillum sp.]
MAAAITDSKHIPGPQELRAAQFRRMKRLATGLLALMFALFVGAVIAQSRWPQYAPQLAYLRAFAEAAMVGAIADWFAVVALFRRPFGLPIPHTAIIPRNKERIGQSLGAFICNNFLAPEPVASKLDSLDVAGRLARWLSDPATGERLGRRAAGLVPALMDALDDETVNAFARGTLTRGLASAQAAPLAARVLSVLVAHGHHQALFDNALDMVSGWLLRNEVLIRERVTDRSWKWLPRWVDRKLADKVMDGSLDTLAELRDPAHPWRGEFQEAVLRFIDRLAHDSQMRARGEAIKAEMLKNPLVQEYLDSVWEETRTRLRTDLSAGEGVVRQTVERAVTTLGTRLSEDGRMRAVGNRWLRRTVERLVVPQRAEIGNFIAGVVARWDTRTLVDKLELQVGRDLQYIRINGTLVGGLVGLLIHALAHLLG